MNAATTIKAALKVTFPSQVFRVRTQRGMVTISWTDGPLAGQVREVAQRVCPAGVTVFCNRDMTQGRIAACLAYTARHLRGADDRTEEWRVRWAELHIAEGAPDSLVVM